ncbi:MAG TPA: XRE family transcriptional regulator [Candidatus Krumholzibacteria bacterium]|nr:XRE family transcriptional regulator [Candidatus Krumholzibacteria bacterium]
MTPGLGDRIKRLRLARDMTLKQVGAKSGVSPTHLSEIERGRTSPTVGALARIAAALGEEASRLVDEAAPRATAVVRAAERRRLHESGVTLHPLSGNVSRREVSVVEITVPPGAAVPPLAAGGEVFILVLEGAVEVTLPSESCALREGDAVHCAGEDCRAARNRGDHPARLLWVASPPALL